MIQYSLCIQYCETKLVNHKSHTEKERYRERERERWRQKQKLKPRNRDRNKDKAKDNVRCGVDGGSEIVRDTWRYYVPPLLLTTQSMSRCGLRQVRRISMPLFYSKKRSFHFNNCYAVSSSSVDRFIARLRQAQMSKVLIKVPKTQEKKKQKILNSSFSSNLRV